MKEVIFVTGNERKFQIVQKLMNKINDSVVVNRQKIETPEIQSTDVTDVAIYSAIWAASELNKPVFVTDVGYEIEQLKGFPGPFIKFINQWLEAEQIIAMLGGRPSSVVIHEVVAYCEPGQNPITFSKKETASITGIISSKPAASPIDRILVRDGYKIPQSDMDNDELLNHWQNNLDHFKNMFESIKEN